ncbi:MAG TPA: flagellar motor protein MotB [Candidatus Brocadiia bacterium]|nr:flagellar motor protein MotB [Candidatus Brocadiia bacterium]
MNKKREEPRPAAAPAYIVSYAALMTILLAFFIMMSTMAPSKGPDLNAKGRLESFVKSFSARGVMSLKRGGGRPVGQPFFKQSYLQNDTEAAPDEAGEFRERVVEPNEERFDQSVVDLVNSGATVPVPAWISFQKDETTLEPGALESLRSVAAAALATRCHVSILVYVSNAQSVPPRFASPWAFTGARAIEAARRLQYTYGLSEDNVEGIGCGLGPPLVRSSGGSELRTDRVMVVLAPHKPTVRPKLWQPVPPRIQMRAAE